MQDEGEAHGPKRSRAEYFRQWRKKDKAAKEAAAPREGAPVAPTEQPVAAPSQQSEQPAQPAETPDIAPHAGVTGPEPPEPGKKSIDISRPPKRLPVRSKGIWQTLPEALREDILLREAEFDNAFKRYEGLGQYALEAEKNGTNLVNVLRDFAGIENQYRTNPVEAPMHVWHALGLNPDEMAQKFGVRFCQDGLPKAYEAGRAAGHQEGYVAGSIAQFAATRPDFESLRPAMAAIASADPSLPIDEVYSRARWSDPNTREVEMMKHAPQRPGYPVSRNDAVARSKSAAKGISGGPSGGSDSKPKMRESVDVFDAVKMAVRSQREGR